MTRSPTVALLVAGAGSVAFGLVASGHELPDAYAPDRLDRGLAIVRMQALSDYVGFEARFALGVPDTTVVMTGGDLCDADVLSTLPGVGELARAAGFRRFVCTGSRGEHASVAVPR